MSRRRQTVNIVLELAESTKSVDSATLADAFVRDLETDEVKIWASAVRSAIADSRRIFASPSKPVVDSSENEKRRLEAQIADLQSKLRRL